MTEPRKLESELRELEYFVIAPSTSVDWLPLDGWAWFTDGGWQGMPAHPVPTIRCPKCRAIFTIGRQHIVTAVGGKGLVFPSAHQTPSKAPDGVPSLGPDVVCPYRFDAIIAPVLRSFVDGDPQKYSEYVAHVARQEAKPDEE